MGTIWLLRQQAATYFLNVTGKHANTGKNLTITYPYVQKLLFFLNWETDMEKNWKITINDRPAYLPFTFCNYLLGKVIYFQIWLRILFSSSKHVQGPCLQFFRDSANTAPGFYSSKISPLKGKPQCSKWYFIHLGSAFQAKSPLPVFIGEDVWSKKID